jgi:uncharacterized protein YwgA
MERKDWALIVLNEAAPGTLSPLQLQKILFLISKNLSDEVGPDFYEFVPYNYGPFAPEIYSDVGLLVGSGLVERVQYTGRNWDAYEITLKGHNAALKMLPRISERATQYVAKTTKWVTSLTFTQLLTAIYKAYPAYKANSVFAQ